MPKYPQFTISFNIATTNEERMEMFELYQKAFHAKKLSEGTPPNSDDIHIMMEICGVEMLLGPGGTTGKGLDNAIVCELRFDNEAEFYRAYDVLIQEGQRYTLEGPFPWATRLALVTDKFGVGWALYYNEYA